MIIVMKHGSPEADLRKVVEKVEAMGLHTDISAGETQTIIGVLGDVTQVSTEDFEGMAGVEKVLRVQKPYKLASRDFRPMDTVVEVGPLRVGGGYLGVIAGPCSVESEAQVVEIARRLKAAGAHALRGGAYKPRTNPYAFQGHKEDGLKMLAAARAETGLPIVTEVVTPADVETVARYADVMQIGARNMQNYLLLSEVGRAHKPVLLKRGMSATLEELCCAAEYIMAESSKQVILCERGIRTFETHSRNTLSLCAVPALKEMTHLPVIVDPSHGTGKRAWVAAMTRAAVAAGADGLIIEAHVEPERALTDGFQTISCDDFARLMDDVRKIAEVVGRKIGVCTSAAAA
ncbi:3-deoxy-7-phosphoheptulonate synthase [bacterium]|nr:3-deoxy-7-phosphoheptulonate synthase [bacterium]